RHHETACEIAPQRVGDHAHAATGRRNSRSRRAFDFAMASNSAGGGSITMPRITIQTLPPMAATSIRYWTSGAKDDFTAMTKQANPAIRSPNTARIEPVMEKLRLCRVVRGLPRKAKVSAANAKG